MKIHPQAGATGAHTLIVCSEQTVSSSGEWSLAEIVQLEPSDRKASDAVRVVCVVLNIFFSFVKLSPLMFC